MVAGCLVCFACFAALFACLVCCFVLAFGCFCPCWVHSFFGQRHPVRFVCCASRGHRFALGTGGLKQSLLVGGIGPVYSLPKYCFKPFRSLVLLVVAAACCCRCSCFWLLLCTAAAPAAELRLNWQRGVLLHQPSDWQSNFGAGLISAWGSSAHFASFDAGQDSLALVLARYCRLGQGGGLCPGPRKSEPRRQVHGLRRRSSLPRCFEQGWRPAIVNVEFA